MRFKLYVQDSHENVEPLMGEHPFEKQQVIFEKNFSAMPVAFGFSEPYLWFIDCESQQVKTVQMNHKIMRNAKDGPIKSNSRSSEHNLPQGFVIKTDPGCSEFNRQKMADNLLKHYQSKNKLNQADQNVLRQQVMGMS